VGSAPEPDVRLSWPANKVVCELHACLSHGKIMDFGSTTGVYVNGERVRQTALIFKGDVVGFGGTGRGHPFLYICTKGPDRLAVLENDPALIGRCAICADRFTLPVAYACGHVFCQTCSDKWRACGVGVVCPTCRAPFVDPPLRLFL